MKVGIVGAGAVGTACLFAMALRGSAREIVLVNRNADRAMGAVTDLQYGAVLTPRVSLRSGGYADLSGAAIVVITAGANEKSGGATDRNDRAGRLRLLGGNTAIYRDIVPRIVGAAPAALLLVVTDPPDPLADVARRVAKHDRVLSSGTFLDSLRFRFHLGRRLEVDPRSVEAFVIGEHGTSQVYLWSTARIGVTPILSALVPPGVSPDSFRREVEDEVRYANINIIEGTGASQLGIGVATARIVEIVLRDEQTVVPIGSYREEYGLTLSLPSQIDRNGVVRVLEPPLSADEALGLEESASALRAAAQSVVTRA
ncbi:MAG: lactate dehydrogenase [Burkholderiales bacterium]|nr:lactate dehydrogenase [Burkholderiales bacterium]